jgi:hypothetical protein
MTVVSKARIVPLVLAALAASGTSYADDELLRHLALQEKLAATTRLDCTFSDKASGRWSGGKSRPTLAPAQLQLTFSKIDLDEGTASAPGTFGAFYIVAKYSGSTLNLIQQQREGPMYATTVFASEASPGRLAAVHVRLEQTSANLAGVDAEPTMYFGSCVAETAGQKAPAPAPAPTAPAPAPTAPAR